MNIRQRVREKEVEGPGGGGGGGGGGETPKRAMVYICIGVVCS